MKYNYSAKCFCGANKETSFPFCGAHYFALSIMQGNILLKTIRGVKKNRLYKLAYNYLLENKK